MSCSRTSPPGSSGTPWPRPDRRGAAACGPVPHPGAWQHEPPPGSPWSRRASWESWSSISEMASSSWGGGVRWAKLMDVVRSGRGGVWSPWVGRAAPRPARTYPGGGHHGGRGGEGAEVGVAVVAGGPDQFGTGRVEVELGDHLVQVGQPADGVRAEVELVEVRAELRVEDGEDEERSEHLVLHGWVVARGLGARDDRVVPR